MTRLRVGDVDAVEQHEHLVERASAHGDVALHAVDATLPYIHARKEAQEFGYSGGRRRGYLLLGHDSHHTRQVGVQLLFLCRHLDFGESDVSR